MKIKQMGWAVVFLFAALSTATAKPYEKLWKQVAQAEAKSLPATVIQLTDSIFRKAEGEKNAPQMLKAYTWRMEYRKRLQSDSFYVDVKGLERWVSQTDNRRDRAVLHSLLADIYATYANRNSWALRQRTAVADDAPLADMREWSSNQFIDRVFKHTDAALQPADWLSEQRADSYLPFVVLGKSSEAYYHHNLLQLLGTRAIESLQRVTSIAADSLVNPRIEAIYKQLLASDRAANRTEGYIFTMLDYLDWSHRNLPTFQARRASGGRIGLTQDPYLAGLNKLVSEFKTDPVCAEVFLARARYAQINGELVAALQNCDEAIKCYPNYARIGEVKNLREEILNPQLQVSVEQSAYPESPLKLRVSHKNLAGFSVVLYRVNLSEMPKMGQGADGDFYRGKAKQTQAIDAQFYRKHCRKIAEKHFDLVRPENYQLANSELTMSAPGEGLYLMQVVPDAKVTKEQTSFMQVTRFKLLTRPLPNNEYEVVALDMQSGHPIADAEITFYSVNEELITQRTTDQDGRIVLPWNDAFRWMKARRGTDVAMPMQAVYAEMYPYNIGRLMDSKESSEAVKLLTDRTLYRPGQTVYVKGIAYKQASDTAQVVVGANYTLTLRDVNGQEVAKQELRSNEFGSFTTSFTLPEACLNGYFTLQTESGLTQIRVESYKRPTFDIAFEKTTQSYQLGDRIELKGEVKSYNGAPLQELPVHYTVTRLLRRGWRYVGGGVGDPIASGTVPLTDAGSFVVPVLLEGDKALQTGYYLFQLEAKVTNQAGETQSTTYTLPVGNQSLLLATNLPGQVCKDDTITTTFQAMNLESQPVAVEGRIYLYPYLSGKPDSEIAEQPAYSGLFTANKPCQLPAWQTLPSGAYSLVLSARDAQNREVSDTTRIVLFSAHDSRPPVESNEWLYASNTSFDAAHPALFYFGTSLEGVHVMVDLFSRDQLLERRTLQLSDSIAHFEIPYLKEYGEGVTVHFCFVKNRVTYIQGLTLDRRLPEKQLKLKWDVFRDKLRPGQQEEWKLSIRTPQGGPASAEILALLYDASLDKIGNKAQSLELDYSQPLCYPIWSQEHERSNYFYSDFRVKKWNVPALVYDRFSTVQEGKASMYLMYDGGVGMRSPVHNALRKDLVSAANDTPEFVAGWGQIGTLAARTDETADATTGNKPRSNFAETALFYPQLRTNEQGEVSFSFTMPESLTRWNFRGFAHTQGMLTGMIAGEATTSKVFMLTPNMPRFVRAGDQATVAASLVNLTEKPVKGVTTFVLFDPLTEQVISSQKQSFSVEAGKSTAICFAFTADERYDLLGCRMVADGGAFSDGEQQLIPVLTNRVELIEAVPMLLRGKEKRTFALDSLFNRQSRSATNRHLTVEWTSNPAWYAVQALPALSQPQTENAIGWVGGYYANTLAEFILKSQPRIRTMFESWKSSGGTKESFLSQLQKNQEVKNILLAESPWVMEARTEQQQRERIATLFDLNTIRNTNLTALTKLQELQLPDGSWAWCKGMNGSIAVTEFVMMAQTRLALLTGEPLNPVAKAMQQSAFDFLHKRALNCYQTLRKAEASDGQVTAAVVDQLNYLYLIAISGESVPKANEAAHHYFLNQLPARIATLNMSEKAMAAIVLKNAGKKQEATEFMASLKEHLVEMPGEGLSFTNASNRGGLNHLQIPAHVAVMEAFETVSCYPSVIEEMKIWLLRQKQTQQWNSPVATVTAIYGLLCTGSDLLANRGDVRIAVGGETLTTAAGQGVIPGLGYLKETFTNRKVVNARNITVEKGDAGIAWGAVYGACLESVDQVTQQGGALSVAKMLYVEQLENNVRQLKPLTADQVLAVGDKVVSRLTIRVERPMQFIQLKDQHAACLEPLATLSGYRWSLGLGYYADVKDAATQLFFDGLDKGVFVVETSYRVTRAGTYEMGLATLQSAYAPEFVTHSTSAKIVVK